MSVDSRDKQCGGSYLQRNYSNVTDGRGTVKRPKNLNPWPTPAFCEQRLRCANRVPAESTFAAPAKFPPTLRSASRIHCHLDELALYPPITVSHERKARRLCR